MKTNKYGALRTFAVINETFAFIFLFGGILYTVIVAGTVSTFFPNVLGISGAFIGVIIHLLVVFFLFLSARALSQLIYLMIDIATDVNDVNNNICVLLEQYQKSSLENQEKIIQLLSKQGTNQIKINEDEL